MVRTYPLSPSPARSGLRTWRPRWHALLWPCTPPSLRGSVIFPGNLGGVNWGSAALDPATGILYANTNRVTFSARLVPRHGHEMTLKLLR
jgi:glucose dehydrogenase